MDQIEQTIVMKDQKDALTDQKSQIIVGCIPVPNIKKADRTLFHFLPSV